jgi:hypothetical protein
MVDKVLAANPKQLADYVGGKTKLAGFFTGQVGAAGAALGPGRGPRRPDEPCQRRRGRSPPLDTA